MNLLKHIRLWKNEACIKKRNRPFVAGAAGSINLRNIKKQEMLL
jgi:Fe-S cluster biogenesis protein NfuA